MKSPAKENEDFTKVLKKEHENMWVALTRSRDRVIGYDEQLVVLREKIGNEADSAVYMRVLPSDTIFAF